MPAWAWTLCEYILLQCWVIPAKDISSACNWFVYIYKNLFRNWFNDARASHWAQSKPCSLPCGLGGMIRLAPATMPDTCLREVHAVLTKISGAVHCWWGWGLLWFETVCTFDMILHFPSHQSVLWILRVCGLIIIVTTIIPFSLFCLQGDIRIFLSFLFFLWKKIVTF